MAEKVFAEGMYLNDRRESTPDWILASFSFKVDEFIAVLQANRNAKGYVNVDVKRSQGGKKYCEVNTFQPTPQADAAGYVANNPPQQQEFNDRF